MKRNCNIGKENDFCFIKKERRKLENTEVGARLQKMRTHACIAEIYYYRLLLKVWSVYDLSVTHHRALGLMPQTKQSFERKEMPVSALNSDCFASMNTVLQRSNVHMR